MNIFREPTSEEKSQMKILGDTEQTVIEKFRLKVESYEAKYHAKGKPYCARCAKFDFKDAIDKQIKEIDRNKSGYMKYDRIDIDKIDFDVYGKEDRFKLVKETDAMDPLPRAQPGTIQRQIKIGTNKHYKCSERGCNIILVAPIETEVKSIKAPKE